MDNRSNKQKDEEALKNKLDSVLNNKDCEGTECIIQDPEELVKREHKKIITNDGRQLLREIY